MNRLSAGDCKELLRYVADKIIENKPLLTEVDSAIGDADHGIGMECGMRQAKESIEKMESDNNAYKVFEVAGKKARIANDACIECGACALNCPASAIEVNAGVGCAAAIIKGWLTKSEPSCDCSGGDCC